MTKKYINKREVKRKIARDILEGKSKREILTELQETYHEKDRLIKIVAGTAHPNTIKQVKALNIILGILVITLVIFRFWTFGIDYAGSGLSVLMLTMGIAVFSFDASSYRFLAVISIITFLRYFSKYPFNTYLLADLIITVVIVALGFYLGNKLFPNYGILGPGKDENSNIIIE